MPDLSDASPPSSDSEKSYSRVAWKDPRFQPAIDSVRKSCSAITTPDGEDDPFIGMLLDRYSWDENKVCELYRRSLERRKTLGLDKVKRDIVEGGLNLNQLPHAKEVRQVISVNGASSLEKMGGKLRSSDDTDTDCLIDGKKVKYGDVLGCYELRYGHGRTAPVQAADGADAAAEKAAEAGSESARSSWSSWSAWATGSSASAAATITPDETTLTPAQFTRYMVYVTQWRWLQCENYIRKHGELGFWSMIHDCSCPAGYVSLWGRMRNLLGQYMPPVEEACAGLFPPMVQKILIINVPRIFGPAWTVISRLLPQHHKDRIVLLTTSYTSAEEVGKYVPQEHMPTHLKEGRPDGPD